MAKFYLIVLAVLISIAGAAVISQSNLPSSEDEEMSWLEAKAAELFGDGFDADDDDDEVWTYDDDDDDNLTNETLSATALDDGTIEIEDMILTLEQFDTLFPSHGETPGEDSDELTSFHRRAALSSKSRRWPRATVYYAFNKTLAGSSTKIRQAMDIWSQKTCMKFVLRSTQKNYVLFRSSKANTCSSALGYRGNGKQYINLSKNCFSKRTILHEIGHTLGLVHEHQHPHRSTHVKIYWKNINPTKKHNFRVNSGVRSYGLAYDPKSIMHYHSTAFRKSGCKSPCYTIQSKTSLSLTQGMGKNINLSPSSDIPIIIKMYCS